MKSEMESVLLRVKRYLMTFRNDFVVFLRWVLLAVLVGIAVGAVGTAFFFSVKAATDFRLTHPWIVWLLPVGGAAVVLLYHLGGVKKPQGTNLVLLAVRSPEPLPLRMAPLIFLSTVMTHFFGGSAGREGAALQMGGSLGFQLGKLLRIDEKDLHVVTMCGMSAAFSALFGTPLTSAIFAMEVVSVGVMYYAALVPCVTASLIAAGMARYFGAKPETYLISGIPAMSVVPALQVALLSALCAGLSIVFCVLLHQSGKLYRRLFQNPYLRAAVGGLLVLLLTFPFGRDYLGAGMEQIGAALGGNAPWQSFLLKMLFTALTLGAGFQGGEIVPSFFVGAAFGCFAGGAVGLSSSFGAAVGLLAVFCGVTNCPLTTLVLGLELFGPAGAEFYLLAAAVSYMLSGYTGLYSRQLILYSKTRPEFLGND